MHGQIAQIEMLLDPLRGLRYISRSVSVSRNREERLERQGRNRAKLETARRANPASYNDGNFNTMNRTSERYNNICLITTHKRH